MPVLDAQFKAADTNGDGRLSPDEYAAAARRLFEAVDADKDGRITAAEIRGARQRVTGREPTAQEMLAADRIPSLDTNSDGTLTPDEYEAGARKLFSLLDTDRDGFLSRSELAAGREGLLVNNQSAPNE